MIGYIRQYLITMIKSFFAFVNRTFNDKSVWLSLIAGFSLVFAYAPFSLWWLVFIVLPLWFVHLHRLQNKQLLLSNQFTATKEGEFVDNNTKKQRRLIIKHSFIFAFGWFASGISWVHVSIDQFGGLPLAISLVLMILLCSYLALFTVLACYLSCYFSKKGQINLSVLPCLWMLGEYLRANVLTGFPWLSLGYSQIDGPLAALAPVIGEIGISLTVLLLCVGLSKILINTQQIFALSSFIVLTLVIVIANNTSWVTLNNDDVNVALIQGNIEQDMRWQPEQEWPTMLKYLQLSRENFDSDLIIWPESAIPALELLVSSQEFLHLVNQASLANNSSIITGIQNYHVDNKEYYNGLIVLGNTENPGKEKPINSYFYNSSNRYYKHHLLPIGEFVPFGDFLRPLAPLFNLSMSSFSKGNYVQSNLRANGLNVLPLICFEIAFANQLAANFSNQTNLLLTVSNDAWFGDSHGPHQHMEIARMRALEFGRPLLRATNNGITAVTDHLGNIQKIAPQFEQYILKAKVQLVTGVTPYYLYGELMRWLLPLLSLVLPLICYRLKNT